MKLETKKQEHLAEQLSKDYDLLGEIEDELRLANTPKEKAKLRRDRDELTKQIEMRSFEVQNSPPKILFGHQSKKSKKTSYEGEKQSLIVNEPPYAPIGREEKETSVTNVDIFENPLPSPVVDFVGREEIFKEINELKDKLNFVVITGITGIGKTAILKHFYFSSNPDSRFWLKLIPGFVTLVEVLTRLARFLDKNNKTNFFEITLRNNSISIQDKINLLIKGLNETDCTLFFDDLHLIEENIELESFFYLLKEQLTGGKVFASSILQPNFIKLSDIVEGNIQIIHLLEFYEDEIKEFLTKKGIKISDEGIENLFNHLGGMPLAVELLVTLAEEETTEERLLQIAENVQGKVIEQLYNALYKNLNDAEKNLLTIASILHLPFTRQNLVELNRKLFNKNATKHFSSLCKFNLIIELGEGYFTTPKILSTLVLTYNDLEVERISNDLAEHLLEIAPDSYYSNLESFLLFKQSENWNRAAEVVSDLIDRYFSRYEFELAQKILNKLEEDKIDPEKWLWVLSDKGEIATRLRKYEEAESFYNSMLVLAKKLNTRRGESLALQRMGVLNIHKDDDIEAEKFYLASLKIKVELGDLRGQSEIHNNLGLIYSDRGDFDLALEELEKGLQIRNQSDSEDWEYLALYSSLGILYARQDNWFKAFNNSQKAYEISLDLNSPYDIAKSLYNLSIHDLEQEKFVEAEKQLLEVFEIAEDHDLDEIRELTCSALGNLYCSLREFEKAIFHFEKLRTIYKKFEQEEKLCKVTFDIGTCYIGCENYVLATNYYLKGLKLLKYLNNEERVESYLNNLFVLFSLINHKEKQLSIIKALKSVKKTLCNQGVSYKLSLIYETLGRIYLEVLQKDRVALFCFRQEIKLLEELNCPEKLVKTLIHLGNIFEETELYAHTLDILHKAIDVVQTNKIPNRMGSIYYNIANIYAKIESYSKAEELYKKGQNIAQEESNNDLLNMIQHNLGEIFRRQGKLEDSINLLKETLAFARKNGDIEDIITNLNSIGLAYEEVGEDLKALTHWHEAVELAHTSDFHTKEANALISIGNFYWVKEDYLQAKNYYEKSLKVAQENEDIEMEESAMISLAEAHRHLGTISEIEKEFIRIAERADELGNQDSLCMFLAISGVINFDEGEVEESAKMFEQSLMITYVQIVNFLSSFAYHTELPSNTFELPYILSRLFESINLACERGQNDLAKKMYENLKKFVGNRQSEHYSNFINEILANNIEEFLNLPT